MPGRDEGGIVKRHGEHLVILRRGRLFTVRVGGDALQPVSMVDAYAPGAEPSQGWYDEMLISGNRVVVIGYSYGRSGTEIGLFDIDAAGTLQYRDTYYLRSNDYYSANNYASRLIGSTLIFYTPLYVDAWSPEGLTYPGLDRWRGQDVPQDFKRLLQAQDIYRADAGLDPMNDGMALHTVTRCELSTLPLQCSATGIVGPAGRVFYVSRDAVYVWTIPWQHDGGNQPKPGIALRLPLHSSPPAALQVRGAPIDQLSFLEDASGHLNVLLQAEGMGEGMWLRDWSAGRMALLRVATTAFGGLDRAAQTADYRVLPSLPEGNRQNRYIGDWLLYGNAPWYSDDDGRPAGEPAYALRYADRGEVVTLQPRHGVERIEAMGSDAVLVGNRGTNLLFTAVELGAAQARVRDTFGLANASQGDSRTHGFFYRNDAEQTGVVGLPVLRADDRPAPYNIGVGSSASVLYLRNCKLALSALGELAASNKPMRDDGCVPSCVDWYGNARPIFIGQRVFALMGYELVEGAIANEAIRERRRVDFTPQRAAGRLPPPIAIE